jgi:hypothetical protein
MFAEFLSKENVASVNKYHDSSRAHRKASLGGKSSPQATKGCRTNASQCPLWICSTYVLSNQETIGGMTATLSERFKTLKMRVQAVQVIAIPIPMTLHPGMSNRPVLPACLWFKASLLARVALEHLTLKHSPNGLWWVPVSRRCHPANRC